MSLQRLTARKKQVDTAERRADTRTKIQLGGLVIKSGLADLLNIQPGDDLQVYDIHFDKVAIILGALLEASELLDDKKEEWHSRGSKTFTYDFLQKERL